MQNKNKQRLLLLGKVTLFLLLYLFLMIAVTTVAQSIFTERKFYPQLPVQLLQYVVGLAVLFFFVKIIDKENIISDVGFSLKNHKKDFFVGGFIGIISMLIGFLIVIKLNFKQVGLATYWIERFDIFIIGTLLMFCAAMMEEIMFRGYMLRKLTERFSVFASLIISSIPFALVHLSNPNPTFLSIVNIFIGSIAIGLLYLKTKNLWLVGGFHFAWNFTQAILGFNVSGGIHMPPILTLNFEEMNTFNGGDFGFEGSYICTIIFTTLLIIYGKNMFAKN